MRRRADRKKGRKKEKIFFNRTYPRYYGECDTFFVKANNSKWQTPLERICVGFRAASGTNKGERRAARNIGETGGTRQTIRSRRNASERLGTPRTGRKRIRRRMEEKTKDLEGKENPLETNEYAEQILGEEQSALDRLGNVCESVSESLSESGCEKSEAGETSGMKTDSVETGEEKKKNLFTRISAWFVLQKNRLKEAIKERGDELTNAKKKRVAAVIGAAALVVFFVLFYLFVGIKIADFVNDPQGFKEWIEGFDEGSIAIFVLLRVIMTVFRVIPGGPLQFASGCAFGTWGGLLWCMVGSLIGTLIIFFLGKRYGTKLVGLFVSPEKMQSAALLKDRKKRNMWLFLMNFIPGTPKDIFTWVAALADGGSLTSMFVILTARIPSVLVSTWCGAQLMEENYLLSGIVFGVLLSVGIVCSLVYKKVTKKNAEKAAEKNGDEE